MKIRLTIVCIIAVIALSLMIAYAQTGKPVPKPKPVPEPPPRTEPVPPQQVPPPAPNAGDDQPIDMTGGSLTVEARNGQWDMTSGKWVHSEIQRYVTKIEVTSLKNGSPHTEPILVGGRTKIDIYDKPARGSRPVVSMETTKGNQGVKIKGTGDPVGPAPKKINFKAGGIVRVEVKEDGHAVKEFDYDPTTFNCRMTIHYCSRPFPDYCTK